MSTELSSSRSRHTVKDKLKQGDVNVVSDFSVHLLHCYEFLSLIHSLIICLFSTAGSLGLSSIFRRTLSRSDNSDHSRKVKTDRKFNCNRVLRMCR